MSGEHERMQDRATTDAPTIALVSNTCRSVYNYRRWLVLELVENGYRVVVMCGRDDYAHLMKELPVEYVPINLDRHGANPIRDLRTLIELRRALRRIDPDVVQATTIKPNAYAVLASSGSRRPVFAMVTGLGAIAVDRPNLKSRVALALLKIAIRSARRTFVQGNHAMSYLVEQFKGRDESLIFLPGSGVDTTFFHRGNQEKKRSGPIRILYAGRLLRSKGLLQLHGLCQRAIEVGIDVELHVVGRQEPPGQDAVSADEIEELSGSSFVSWHGETKDVRPYMERAEIVALLSTYGEGFPKSVLEACSMECVPMVPDADTYVQALEREGAALYIRTDSDGRFSFESFREALQSRASFPTMEKRARSLVRRRYEVSEVNAIILNEYRDALREN